MGYLLGLAWKNITRYKRRTVMTFIMFSVSMALYIIMASMFAGFDRMTAMNYIDFETGHFKFQSRSYDQDEPFSVSNFIANPGPVMAALKARPEVRSVTARVLFQAEADNGVDSTPCIVTGIDTVQDGRVFSLTNYISAGKKTLGASEAFVGANLAKDLGVGVGDPFYLTFRNGQGMIDSVELTIAGLLMAPDPAVTASGVYIDLASAASFLNTKGVTEISVRVDNYLRTGRYMADLAKTAPDLKIHEWKELAKDVMNLSQTKQKSVYMLVFSLLVIGCIGIINTMLMSVFEKTKEIGMLKAIGMRDRDILRLFLSEGFVIGFLGGLIGVAFGCLCNIYFVVHGWDIGSMLGKGVDLSAFRSMNIIYSVWDLKSIIGSLVLCAGLSTLASWYPAQKAVQMQAVECLRTI